ncbi:hypothetical protein FA15DRAFT_619833 [Coprinopsis marcescibilis]|uniref:UBR-type domain-containing protein n=1 Tax=Coprinopsis marcescibilis TaxID=230819 RepID=A0A5C3L794_COPMA|nr:hypothetical protein FA15DRAFT_619833 [Coprinopsis marcescibilis]
MSQTASGSTLQEYLERQDDLVREAGLALPHQFSHCTYPLGYLRQPVYLCLTCKEPRGICAACSIACHTQHEQIELFPKRDFRCDCPTSAIPRPCSLETTIQPKNEYNKYGQNFRGAFCRCGRPYDAEKERETMIQCLSCEDWFHESCCNLRERPTSRAPTPEVESKEKEEPTPAESTEEDARSETSCSSLPPALITAADYDSFVCGACVSKIKILKKYAGTPGAMIVGRDALGSEWRRIGDLIGKDDDVAIEDDDTPNAAGSKRRLVPSSDDEHAPEPKRTRTASDPTLNEVAPCLAPRPNPLASKVLGRDPSAGNLGTGDVFLTDGFRERWCHCEDCRTSLENHRYLVEEEETYEPPEDPDSGLSLEELGMRALSRLPHGRAIDGIHAFNKMRDGFKSFFEPFAAQGKVVDESDVRDFFEKLKDNAKRGG